MTALRRASATVRRAAARLLPAEHRDWAEALWAEAHDVPRGLPRLAWRAGGLPRLAWRAGGLRLIAREATMARRLAGAVLFGAAAAFAVWAAWPGPPAGVLVARGSAGLASGVRARKGRAGTVKSRSDSR